MDLTYTHLSCTYLAHHELESVIIIMVIIIIIITTIIIIIIMMYHTLNLSHGWVTLPCTDEKHWLE